MKFDINKWGIYSAVICLFNDDIKTIKKTYCLWECIFEEFIFSLVVSGIGNRLKIKAVNQYSKKIYMHTYRIGLATQSLGN